MKIVKKAVAILLVIAMLMSLLVTTAFAASNVTVEVDKSNANVGDTVVVTVKNNAMKISSFIAYIRFNTEQLECTSIKGVKGGIENNNAYLYDTAENDTLKCTAFTIVTEANSDGVVSAVFAGTGDANYAAGTIFKATFKVKAAGSINISLYEDSDGADGNPAGKDEVSCGSVSVTVAAPPIAVTNVTLDQTTLNLNLKNNETAKLIATVTPDNADNKTVTWTSSNAAIAEVDNSGNVTAKAVGTATITARAGDKSAQCSVTVVNCDHKNLTHNDAVSATCTVDGNIEYWSCDDCGALFSDAAAKTSTTRDAVTIRAEHKLTPVAASAPTCTEAGTIAHKHCTVCQKNFNDSGKELASVTEAALGHTGGTADCKNKATCTRCGESYGELGNHKLATHVKKDATCTDQGYETYYSCTVGGCGKLFSDAQGNNVIAAPTVINALGHDLKKTEAKAATCEATGNIDYWTCSRCHKLFKDKVGTQEIEAGNEITAKLSHDMTYHAAAPATCTDNGTVEYWSCSICEKNYSDAAGTTKLDSIVDPAKGHTMTKTEAVAPTCTEGGNNEYYYCSVCMLYFEDKDGETKTTVDAEKINALGHDYGTQIAEVPATCTKEGTKAHYQCSRCKELFLDTTSGNAVTESDLVIAKIAHGYTGIYNETHHWTFCANCGATTDKAAHDFTVDETTGTKTCSSCGYKVYGEGSTPCDKHDTKFVFDENYHWHVCKNCSYAEDKVAHDFDEWVIDVEATTTETGLRHRTCKECRYVQQEVIAKKTTTPARPSHRPSGGSSATSSDKVQSSKTFDAGIAAYVGLSVLSLTGSALVIGKKKEF